MGVILLCGDIPAGASSVLTEEVRRHGGVATDEPIQDVRFGIEHAWEGGLSEETLEQLLRERLGSDLVSLYFEEDRDALDEQLVMEMLRLQAEVRTAAWGQIDPYNKVLAAIYGPEFLDKESWTWLDDGHTFEPGTPFYVFTPSEAGGELVLQKGGHDHYGHTIAVPPF